MKLSNISISVVSMFVAAAAAYAILAPQDFALRGLAWVTLASAALALSVALVVRRSPRSIAHTLDDVDHERNPSRRGASALPPHRKETS